MSINLNEDFIKRAFLHDIKDLTERAEKQGVTAYAEKLTPSGGSRLRPNERFLRNTIASVEHSNRRGQEKEMWARRNAQLERQGISTGASPSRSPASAGASPDDDANYEKDMDTNEKGKQEKQDPIKYPVHNRRNTSNLVEGGPGGAADEDLQKISFPKMLGGNGDSDGGGGLQRKVRGRGGTGPRIGPTGPYVPDPQIGLDTALVEEKNLKRKLGSLKSEKRKKDGNTERGDSGNSCCSSSDSEDEDEESRRRKERKRRRRKEKASGMIRKEGKRKGRRRRRRRRKKKEAKYDKKI